MPDSKEAEIRDYYKEQRRLDREAEGPQVDRQKVIRKDRPKTRNNFDTIDRMIDNVEEYPDHDE